MPFLLSVLDLGISMTLNLPSLLLWTVYADLYFALYKSITSIFIAEAARFELAEPLWFATLAKWWYKPLTQASKKKLARRRSHCIMPSF